MRQAYVYLFISSILWGSSFVALKYSLMQYDGFFVIFGRLAVASLFFIFFIKRFTKVRFQKGDWKYIFLMSLFEPCLYFIFEAKALVNTTASQAGMITAVLPLFVAILAFFFLKEKLTKKSIFGASLAVVGVLILSLASESNEYAPNPILGNFYELLAMVCAAGYTIVLKHLTSRFDAFFLTATQAFIGAIFFGILLAFNTDAIPTIWHMPSLASIVYLGLFVTIGAYYFYNVGVSKIDASIAVIFINLIPVFTAMIAYVFLDESLNITQFFAALLVLGGVFVSSF